MKNMIKHILASFFLLFAASAMAQEAAPADPVESAAGARAQVPQEITRDVVGDWQVKCRIGETEQCFLFQLVLGAAGNPMLEYSLVPLNDPENPEVILGGNMVTPLNTVLPRGILQVVDEGEPVRRPYGYCSPVGCFSRYGLSQAEVDAYSSGTTLKVAIFTIQAPNQEVSIPISLDGFGEAYEKLQSYQKSE